MSTIKTNALRTVRQLKQTWHEMNYVQRRALEIRLGLPLDDPTGAESRRGDPDELEVLFRTSPRR